MIAHNTQDPLACPARPGCGQRDTTPCGPGKIPCRREHQLDLTRSVARALEEDGKVDGDAMKTIVSAANLMKNWGEPLQQVQRSIAQLREPLEDAGCPGHNIDDKRVRDVYRRHLRTRKHDVIMAKPSGLSTRRKLYEFSRALRK